MAKVLDASFFDSSALNEAKDLLGKFLVRRLRNGEIIADMIVETEAYEGPDDLASHASKGRTLRTEVMFGPPGRLYIFSFMVCIIC